MREFDIPNLLTIVYKTMRRYGVSNVIKKLKEIEGIEYRHPVICVTESIDVIINEVCAEYRIKRSHLLEGGKSHSISEAKKMAIVLTSEMLPVSSSEIGSYFNRHNRSVYRILKEYQSMNEEIKWHKKFLEKKRILTIRIKPMLVNKP